jgi:hypothetical protein
MATKKSKKSKKTKPKKAVSRKAAPKKSKKKASKKAPPRRRIAPKTRSGRGQRPGTPRLAVARRGLGAASGGQSGALQGLPSVAGADSESVEELLEEGNTLEAEAVKGVQDADNADEGEVVTHEVPEDDVPEEYLDEN